MPDINSIQEDRTPEVEQKPSAGFKQKLTALLTFLQNRFAKFFTSPTFDKIKQNPFLLYSAIGGVALLVVVLLLLLILLLLPSKKSAPEKLESTPLESQISQEEMQKLLSAPLPAPSIEEEPVSYTHLTLPTT